MHHSRILPGYEESDEVKDHPQEALTQVDPADKVGRTWRVAKKDMVWLRG